MSLEPNSLKEAHGTLAPGAKCLRCFGNRCIKMFQLPVFVEFYCFCTVGHTTYLTNTKEFIAVSQDGFKCVVLIQQKDVPCLDGCWSIVDFNEKVIEFASLTRASGCLGGVRQGSARRYFDSFNKIF